MMHFESMHFLTGEELSQRSLHELLDTAEELKEKRGHRQAHPLKNKTVALMFDKPSLRTRLSFTVGIQELGGHVVELLGTNKKNEEPEDAMGVLQGMVHGVMYRTFEHSVLERMASVSAVPVINGLSDTHHPCQAIADLLTLKQKFGRLKGLKLAYIGDGNNVLHSLLLLLPFVGVDVHYSCPKGYEPEAAILSRANLRAKIGGAQIRFFSNPEDAVKGTHAVYTDVWASMGQENEQALRAKAFAKYQVNLELFSLALPNAVAMHCLPMLRGQEITSEVADHSRSVIFHQAENRLHAQKALIVGLFEAKHKSLEKGTVYPDVVSIG